MLKNLNVENYALIERLELNFAGGMSIVTGETGAGKSILLGALSLVLGGRADVGVLKDRDRNCVVEGIFSIDGCGLESVLEQNEIEYDPELVVRRTINPAGKSRAFINDVPVGANVLRDVCGRLIDIHSQHENLLLSNRGFQLSAIDAVTEFGGLKESYRDCFGAYRRDEKKLEELIAENARAKADYDYFKFQFEQLHGLKLKPDEQEELESEVRKLSNVEEIKSGYEKLSTILAGENVSVINMLKESETLMLRLSKTYPPAGVFAVRIGECLTEIKDVAGEGDRIYDSLYVNPESLAEAENRLNAIYDLQQKHRVGTIGELLAIQADCEERLRATDGLDDEIDELRKSAGENLAQLERLSGKISELRRRIIPFVENHVSGLLKQLGMPNVVFKVELSRAESYTSEGVDDVAFLFSANRDMQPREIAKVASGGEMSRLMLSLKSLLVRGRALPTIIFDEIDTGISGEVADRMGEIIKNMSHRTQVINITHLPQIAAKGENHYLVYKEDTEKATFTRVVRLNAGEREREIAKMLSGSKITESALQHARELLQNSAAAERTESSVE